MTYTASTNQIATIAGVSTGIMYDNSGNLLQDGTGTGAHAYTYDPEQRLHSVATPPGTTVATYVCNALGQRAERTGTSIPHGGTLDEYYDASGE